MRGKLIASLSLSVALISQSAFAEVIENFIETPLATAFGEPPTVGDPLLSPDGPTSSFRQQINAVNC